MKDIKNKTEPTPIYISSKQNTNFNKATIQNPEFLIITPDNKAIKRRKIFILIPIFVLILLLIAVLMLY